MYVILTSKQGQFHTEALDGVRPCEAYDYLFYGRKKARFVIAELLGDVKIRVIDETPPGFINDIPSRLFAKFATVESAREELRHLTTFGSMQTALQRVS